MPRQSLAHCLPVVYGPWCRGLLGPPARRRLAAVAETLPAELLQHQLGFESDLGDGAARADLLVALTRARGGPAMLRTMAAEAPADDAAWSSVGELAELWGSPDWAKRLDDVWLEFDVHGPVPRTPSLFVGPRLATSDAEGWDAWLGEVAPVLLGRTPSAALRGDFHHCRKALPERAHIFQVGAMRSRPSSGLRLCLNQLYLDRILSYLPAIGIDQGGRLRSSFIALQTHADAFAVQIDVPPGAPPRLGLECYLDARARARPLDERWCAFLGWLEALGLCRPEKRVALGKYTGRIHATEAPDRWPARLSSLQPLVSGASTLHRSIHHVKLDFVRGVPVRAKAYLSIGHEWLPYAPPSSASSKMRSQVDFHTASRPIDRSTSQ